MRHALTAAVFSLLAFPAAQADTLSFDGASCTSAASGVGAAIACGNGSYISQAHGDSAHVDVRYASSSALGGARSMYFWASGYSGLQNVVYGDNGATAELTLASLDGSRIQLDGMVFGSWLNGVRSTRIQVFDLGSSALLFDSGVFNTAGATPNSLSFSNVSSNAGLRLALGPDFFNVGLDSLSYTVTPVPEPATLALMAGGLGLLALRRRRAGASNAG